MVFVSESSAITPRDEFRTITRAHLSNTDPLWPLHGHVGHSVASDRHWMITDSYFAAIVNVRGCFGICVDKPSQLSGALEQALAAGCPVVMDVKTNMESIAPNPWIS